MGGFVETMQTEKRILVLHENGGHHVAFSARAKPWLDNLAQAHGFAVDYAQSTDALNDTSLRRYALVFQMDYPPYGWTPDAATAFENYITNGIGGWVGLHHAALLGEFDGYPMWNWFSRFLGDIRYENYNADFASATVVVENTAHPVMRGVPAAFPIAREEWYTFNRSPRPNVYVLARVDEATYVPNSPIKMGDHPVAWTNPNVAARNVYLFMGHGPELFDNSAYTTLLQNALLWAAGKDTGP